jgi:hypothetical protein
MVTTNEIASITILLHFQKGNELVNQIIPFKVFRKEEQYKAIPLISPEERKHTGLSEELCFSFNQNRIVTEVETNAAGVNAINNIAGELRLLRIV